MRRCKPLTAALTVGPILVGAANPSRAAGPDGSSIALARDWIARASQAAGAWIVDGYATAPALMVGLAVLALIPPLAIVGYIINRTTRRRPQAWNTLRTAEAAAKGLGWPADVWIAVDYEGGELASERRRLPRELMSIGRAVDNDLVLAHPTVHRHHAVINRSDDTRIVIRDLSGSAGNGVLVNGRRVEQAALTHGDRIEIGKVILTFEASPV